MLTKDAQAIKGVNKVLAFILIASLILALPARVSAAPSAAGTCEYWVAPAPAGNDSNPGTSALPWATINNAAKKVLASGGSNCTVWVKDGIYNGVTDFGERFATMTTFKAVNPYKAILQHTNTVVVFSGAKNVTLEGFEIRHSTATTTGIFLIYGSASNGVWSENVVIRNNILHDSYNEDLLKFTSGAKLITIEGNVLYNQGAGEEHMDINSVTDSVIQDNIFFNDFAGSNRTNTLTTKHFIVIKDSSGTNDGNLGAQRITVRRNIFLHFEGGKEGFIQVGNDGKAYYEAIDVRVENNLMIGDGSNTVSAVFGVAGAKNVTFVNNTVTGNLPSSAYAFRVVMKGSNPQNQNITFYNNIWTDPTGTMGKFSNGTPSMTTGLALDNNAYWNGASAIPSGDLISPAADGHHVFGNPLLNPNPSSITLPRWKGTAFASGSTTIREEFLRLVNLYAATGNGSPVIDKANPALAPKDDILGQPRGTSPDIGAYEKTGAATVPTSTNTVVATSTTTSTVTSTATSTQTATGSPVPPSETFTSTPTNVPASSPTSTFTQTATTVPSFTPTNTTAPTTATAATFVPASGPTPTSTSGVPTRTPNQSASNIQFAVIGDYGTSGTSELKVSQLVKSWNPDFVITTGDNNYDVGAASTIDLNIGQYYHQFIFPYTGTYGAGSDVNRFFPSLGNHDWGTPNAQPYINYFTLPGNERYYDYVWGPVHFFAIDSDTHEPNGTSSTSTQATWLKNKLAGSTSKWKIVYFHHSPYSSGQHGSMTYMQWPFQQWGASAVLSGHDHDYERVMKSGFPYIVDGLGGTSIRTFATPISGSTVRYSGNYGALRVEADNNQIRFRFIAIDGTLVDDYTLTSTAPQTSTATSVGPTSTRTATSVPPTFTPTYTSTPLAPPSTNTTIPTTTVTSAPASTVTATGVQPTATSISVPPSSTPTETSIAIPASDNTPTPTTVFTPTVPPATPTQKPTSAPPKPDLIFANGFESGNLSEWSSTQSSKGGMSIQPNAALVGANGLQVTMGHEKVNYVTDASPHAETRYRARFYFDPNSVKMRNTEDFYIFAGSMGEKKAVPVMNVEFRYENKSYLLRARLIDDKKKLITSKWFKISDAPHTIEIDWKASTGKNAKNGSLTMWIDGKQVVALTKIDNDTLRIDSAQLGAVYGVNSGATGAIYFDAFESRRQTYIGP